METTMILASYLAEYQTRHTLSNQPRFEWTPLNMADVLIRGAAAVLVFGLTVAVPVLGALSTDTPPVPQSSQIVSS